MQIHRTRTSGIATSVVVLLVAAVVPAMAQPSSDLADYALFADENITARGLTVLGGDVGVNHGPLTSTRSLDAPHSNVVADRVDLDPASRCAALFASSGQAAAACGPPTSFTGPLVADLASACGFPDDEVACDPSRPISVGHDVVDGNHAAGSYGKVEISGGGRGPGTLKLGPGRYVFCSLDMARHGRLDVDGDTEIVVTGSVWIDNGATVGPTSGGAALADLVRLFVGGDRIRISRRAAVQALLCAPHAQMTLRQGAALTGRFAARDIRSDRVFVTGVAGAPSTSSSTTVPTSSSSSTTRPSTTTVLPTTSTTSSSTSSTLAPGTTSSTAPSTSTTSSSSTTAIPSTSTTSTLSTTSSTSTSTGPATTSSSSSTTAAPTTSTGTTETPTTSSTTAEPTTSTTTSSTSSTTLGSVGCGPGGIAIDLAVPYDEVGAPQLSGVRMNVQYTAVVSMPNIPGTSFADPSRLMDLSGKGPFLLAQDVDTNADTVEDRLSIVFTLTNNVFVPGSIVRATFDCNAGVVSASTFTCALDQASDVVGNDVANPAGIPCRIVAIAPAP